MQDNSKTPVVGYIRVSSVGGRSGESFIGPPEQKRSIEELAAREGLEVISWLQELDASGGKVDRPQWQEALAMVERGEASGIAVWNLARFSRDLVHARQAIERLEAVGGDLYSATEKADGFTRDVLFLMAERQRLEAKEGFETAVRNAIERGVYVGGHVPFGFRKHPETKRLTIPDEARDEARVMHEVFERRANGASITALRDYVQSQGYQKNHATIRDWLGNRVFLGEVRARGYVNANAHEAIVTEELFDRANVARGVRPVPTGKTQAMLKSLCRCAGCGAGMVVRGKTKDSNAAYYCRGYNIGGCSSRAHVKLEPLDAHVDALIVEALEAEDAIADARERDDRLEEATSVLAQAEADYLKLKSNPGNLLDAFGEDAAEVVTNAKARVELARIDRANAANAAGRLEGFNGSMREVWPTLTKAEKREILHGLIGEVRVSRGREPLSERVTLLDRDGALLFEPDGLYDTLRGVLTASGAND